MRHDPYVGETFSATDTPKTDILVKATSQVAGGTASRVTCKNASNVNVGNSPQPSASTFADPAEVDGGRPASGDVHLHDHHRPLIYGG